MSDRIIRFSNFATAGRLKNTLAISRTVPRWYKGERDIDLAPPREVFDEYRKTGDIVEFISDYSYYIYNEINIPQTVEDCLGKTLLCWCSREELCHRQILAKIFEREMGVKVVELGGWNLTWWADPFEKTEAFIDIKDLVYESDYEAYLKLKQQNILEIKKSIYKSND
ncbi:MAG: hypothetical protein P1P64_09925 [Treponemataceae bacterium]